MFQATTPLQTTMAGLLLAGVAAAQPLEIVDDVPGAWIEFIGTPLPLFGDDVLPINSTVGNAVFPAGRVLVGNNGAIGFEPPTGANLPALNDPIPSNNLFAGGQSLAAYWDDLEDEIDPGVTWGVKDNVLIVEYIRHVVSNHEIVEFQIQVPGTPSGPDAPIYAQFVYRRVTAGGAGASATIGYQDGSAGFNDVLWSFNTPGAVVDGDVLTLVPEPATGLLVFFAASRLRRR